MPMYMRVNKDDKLLEMLMKISDTDEMRKAHTKIESAILAIRVKERMSAQTEKGKSK